jgi:hypothetical protein
MNDPNHSSTYSNAVCVMCGNDDDSTTDFPYCDTCACRVILFVADLVEHCDALPDMLERATGADVARQLEGARE